jgi:hypothetical protein
MPLPRASTFGSFNEQDELVGVWSYYVARMVLKWQMVKGESSSFSRKIDK